MKKITFESPMVSEFGERLFDNTVRDITHAFVSIIMAKGAETVEDIDAIFSEVLQLVRNAIFYSSPKVNVKN